MKTGRLIVGMDEVGRGSWAGPLLVGAVILATPIPGVGDSKLLTKRQREDLDRLIREQAKAYAIGRVSNVEIDTLGLTAASALAYERALNALASEYDEVIVDGSYNYLPAYAQVRTLVDADAVMPAVSAASIIAKVARDRLMQQLAAKYPSYGFERHVGYGTAAHAAALLRFGPCDIHRQSFAPVRKCLKAAA